jgi:hypothetical protein
MYIVSKFSDYYDGVMGLGIDKTVVYNRTTSFAPYPDKRFDPELYDLLDVLPSTRTGKQATLRGMVLLICGEAIPFIQIEIDGKKNNFYSKEKLVDFCVAKDIRTRLTEWFWRRESIDSWAGMERFLSNKKFSTLTRLHHINKCPIILCTSQSKEKAIVLNPNLKELGYQTQKDPYTLFQNIYMFISGVLGVNERPMVEVSDKDLADKRGHGGEYSFRTAPGQGKGKRLK